MLSLNKPLSRNEYLQVVRTGLLAHQYSFSRQALLNWLATYPGDLEAGLYYAQSLIGERYYSQAVQVLLGLTYADPEYAEAVETFVNLIDQVKTDCQPPESLLETILYSAKTCQVNLSLIEPLEGMVRNHWFALKGSGNDTNFAASWGEPIFTARQALIERNFGLAGELIKDLLTAEPAHPLIAITHLRILGNSDTSQDLRYTTVKNYSQRWPDNLEIMLRLADWSMERSESDQAVALLHQSVSRDVTGQVIRRVWGDDHPFRTMWPENLELKMNVMIPAVVAAVLGWNRLTSGTTLEVELSNLTTDTTSTSPLTSVQEKGSSTGKIQSPQEQKAFSEPVDIKKDLAQNANRSAIDEIWNDKPIEIKPDIQPKEVKNEIRAVEREIEKLAAKYKVSGLTRQDGRFPVYVVLSLRGMLQSVYGTEQAGEIEKEMLNLAAAVRTRLGWDALVCFVDDLTWAKTNGTKPVRPEDPWAIKMALSDLDNSLAKRGERIGALLIVGGAEIVPYHLLPNPVEDQDRDIPSDNPYATLDRNYFVPEWPVGRLPGGAGNDPGLILKSLRKFQLEHRSKKSNCSIKQQFSNWFDRGFKNLFSLERESFGYTAEIWLEAARSVFRPIGNPGWLCVSPPSGMPQQNDKPSKENLALTGVPALGGQLGYFNLHGLIDSNEWYGHRNSALNKNYPDYPVALRPDQIQSSTGKGSAPRIVFSEACYGLNIQNRTLDEAISLKMLDAGTLAIAGSTSMAYGSIDARPMMAADLLGYTFWRFLISGLTAGEALRQAKLFLVGEMKRRQGYLDGEDQKTLISFILFGDPMADLVRCERSPSSVRHSLKNLTDVKTVEKPDQSAESGPIPPQLMDSIREVVAKYLPGMTDARLAYIRDAGTMDCASDCLSTVTPKKKKTHSSKSNSRDSESPTRQSGDSFRSFVTLSKKFVRQGEIHPEIARLTLDEKGKLVKLVVSR